MKKYISTKAVCPFYKYEKKSVIYCEGVFEGSVIHLAFSRPSVCFNYKKTYCKENYAACPIAIMLKQLSETDDFYKKEDILSFLF